LWIFEKFGLFGEFLNYGENGNQKRPDHSANLDRIFLQTQKTLLGKKKAGKFVKSHCTMGQKFEISRPIR
jgi:hypothetical protein